MLLYTNIYSSLPNIVVATRDSISPGGIWVSGTTVEAILDTLRPIPFYTGTPVFKYLVLPKGHKDITITGNKFLISFPWWSQKFEDKFHY